MTSPRKPILKWAGGKRWLVPKLIPIWERYSNARLVEPFCGGLAIALGLSPATALLNDINPHLINFYKWVARGLEFETKMSNDSSVFYSKRKEFNKMALNGASTSKQAAELFYYLNRTCFNGLCRFNRQGEFNVPFGRHSQVSYLSDLYDYKFALARWKFKCGDYREIKTSGNDFIYADPPYDVEFTNYSGNHFSWENQVELAHWLSSQSGPVVTTNQATERIVSLYTSLGFKLLFTDGPLRIHSKGNRAPAKVIIGYKNLGANTSLLKECF